MVYPQSWLPSGAWSWLPLPCESQLLTYVGLLQAGCQNISSLNWECLYRGNWQVLRLHFQEYGSCCTLPLSTTPVGTRVPESLWDIHHPGIWLP